MTAHPAPGARRVRAGKPVADRGFYPVAPPSPRRSSRWHVAMLIAAVSGLIALASPFLAAALGYLLGSR